MSGNPAPTPTPAPAAAPAGDKATAAPAPKAGGLKGKLQGLFKTRKSSASAAGMGELARGVLHRDSPTRWGSVIYFLSVVGIVVTSFLSLKAIFGILSNPDLVQKKESVQGTNLNKFFREQKEMAFSKEVTLVLGTFNFEARPPEGAKERRGTMNIAEVEITVECETIPTCRFLEANGQKAKDQIFNQMIVVDQKDLITAEGKRRVKDTIRARLNEWLGSQNQGRIKRVYFTKLLVT